MSNKLRVVVADDDQKNRELLKKTLTDLGHEVLAVGDGEQLVETCRRLKPDVVLADGIKAAAAVYAERPTPVLLFSTEARPADDGGEECVAGYLTKPVKPGELAPTLRIAVRRFEEYERLRRERDELKQSLAERELIEHAKGILMSRTGMDEPAAFRRMQKLASERNLKLADLAFSILTAQEALAPSVAGGL
ncbi:MAG: ANTAR domain-containing response regulator [Planctomycetia bacterium]